MFKIFIFIFSLLMWLQATPELSVHLSFEKRKYRKNEPIEMRISIRNLKKEMVEIHLDHNLFKHFLFNIQNDKNIEMPFSSSYLVWSHSTGKSSATSGEKQLCLGYKDEYTLSVNLLKWFDLSESGFYFIKGEFMLNPGHFNRELLVYESSEASFFIDKDFYEQIEEGKKKEMQKAHDLINVPPYEIADMYMRYEKERNWDNYFRCIDLADFLDSSFRHTSFYERYHNSLNEERDLILNEFKSFLIKSVNYRIVEYNIKQTVITGPVCNVTIYSKEQIFAQNYINHFNPDTLQVEVDWVTDPADSFIREKETVLRLKYVGSRWRITRKEVTILNRY